MEEEGGYRGEGEETGKEGGVREERRRRWDRGGVAAQEVALL